MELNGEYRIPASREQVWEALNDPEVLRASIPGCESLERMGENGFTATVTAKVGPVKAKFKGEVTLSDLDPPNGYTISGEGKGGAAGFARGGARISLEDDGGETILRYQVEANVGGKLAQLGSRLIDGAARKLSDEFFTKFGEEAVKLATATLEEAIPEPIAAEPMVEEAPVAAPAAPEIDVPEPSEVPAGRGLPSWVWVAGLFIVVLLLLFSFS